MILPYILYITRKPASIKEAAFAVSHKGCGSLRGPPPLWESFMEVCFFWEECFFSGGIFFSEVFAPRVSCFWLGSTSTSYRRCHSNGRWDVFFWLGGLFWLGVFVLLRGYLVGSFVLLRSTSISNSRCHSNSNAALMVSVVVLVHMIQQ